MTGHMMVSEKAVDSMNEELSALREKVAQLEADVERYKAQQVGLQNINIMNQATMESEIARLREEQSGTQVELAWSDGKMTVVFVPQDTAPWATDLPNLLYRHAPDSAAEIEKLREANTELLNGLRWIQDHCSGDAMPRWENTPATGHSRGLILDQTNRLIAKHGGSRNDRP